MVFLWSFFDHNHINTQEAANENRLNIGNNPSDNKCFRKEKLYKNDEPKKRWRRQENCEKSRVVRLRTRSVRYRTPNKKYNKIKNYKSAH